MSNFGKFWSIAALVALLVLIALVAMPTLSKNRIDANIWQEIARDLRKATPVPDVIVTSIPLPTPSLDTCNPNEELVFASQLFADSQQVGLSTADPMSATATDEACVKAPEGGIASAPAPGGTQTPIPDTAACVHNPNAEVDECGIGPSGNACKGRSTPDDLTDDSCCEWTVSDDYHGDLPAPVSQRGSCSCSASVLGPCMNEAACTACMLIAEASTETNIWCKQMVLCTMRERKKWKGDENQCVTNARKTGNGTWFTPDKATCDHVAPNMEKNPNQQYYDCRLALCNGGTFPGYDNMLPLLGFQCPANSPNFYNNNCGNPCDNGGGEVAPPAGVTCKHKFYRCTVP